MTTPPPTIDRRDTFGLFGDLMQPEPQFRVLRLIGDAKLGKTHFASKVFPHLAKEDYGAECAVVDLRRLATSDVLHNLSAHFGDEELFPAYIQAYQSWLERDAPEIRDVRALFSVLTIRSPDGTNNTEEMERHLVTCLAQDLSAARDRLFLFIFDRMDDSTSTSKWVMDTLLVHVSHVPNVRVIVAGRSVPTPSASYAALCCEHVLQPVKDEEAYISFCRASGLLLSDESIRTAACVCDYVPGSFVDALFKLEQREAARDS